MEVVEHIISDNTVLAYLVRAELNPSETTFITPSEDDLQLGFVVYPKGGHIRVHSHVPVERHFRGTAEALIVKKGRCIVDIYNDDQQLVATRELNAGDIILLLA